MATPAQRLPRYGHHTHRAPDWAGSGHVYRPPLFHRERSVETVRLMTPITERLSARATTATERVRFALGCGHVVAVTVAQGNLPIYP